MRSSWEHKFAQFLDLNENIIQWNSEGLVIPYLDPNDDKMHRYFPDFIIKLIDKDGVERNVIIEIKPIKETKPPTSKKKNKSYLEALQLYHKNLSKWEAATEYCKTHNVEFKILTEQNLGI